MDKIIQEFIDLLPKCNGVHDKHDISSREMALLKIMHKWDEKIKELDRKITRNTLNSYGKGLG